MKYSKECTTASAKKRKVSFYEKVASVCVGIMFIELRFSNDLQKAVKKYISLKRPSNYKTLRKIKEYTPEYGIHNNILTLQQPDIHRRGSILKGNLERRIYDVKVHIIL